jgi:hypothetical protein
MVDIPINSPGSAVQWRGRPNSRLASLAMPATLLVAFLILLAWTWSAVATQYAEKRCDSPLGKFAVRFKLDSYYSNCQCMTHALDFSDPCNSMYLGIL